MSRQKAMNPGEEVRRDYIKVTPRLVQSRRQLNAAPKILATSGQSLTSNTVRYQHLSRSAQRKRPGANRFPRVFRIPRHRVKGSQPLLEFSDDVAVVTLAEITPGSQVNVFADASD